MHAGYAIHVDHDYPQNQTCTQKESCSLANCNNTSRVVDCDDAFGQMATLRPNGDRVWLRNGYAHRLGDKPAFIGADGAQIWAINGRKHRDGDKPAHIYADGGLSWIVDKRLHRDGDKPCGVYSHGLHTWWRNGAFVRVKAVTKFGEHSLRFAFVWFCHVF